MNSSVLPNKKYLRWDEVLKYFEAYGITISRATLYNWSDMGTLETIKIGGTLWFIRESIVNIVKPSTNRSS